MAELRFIILGCGSSGGVPRLGGFWGACDPEDPRNRRQRCSLLIERHAGGGVTRVLIDTSPDLRNQLLAAGVGVIDAVVYTHDHADHTHGIDDLRMIVFNRGARLPVWATPVTQKGLMARFSYAFIQPEDSNYPPILDMHTIEGPLRIDGPGGAVTLSPIEVQHGNIRALGFRVADVVYMPDVNEIPEAAWPQLAGLECWIIDALRYRPHPSHAHLDRTLGWIERAAPRRAIVTNMHIDLDYATLAAETPDHVIPAYDGRTVSFTV